MKKLKFILIIVLAFFAILISACKKETPIVILDSNGGKLESSEVILSNKNELTLPTPLKEGKTFLGWYDV